MIKVMLTCVGGELMPQTIKYLRNIKGTKLTIIGTDIYKDAIGKYFCEKFYIVPKGNSKSYIDKCKKIIKKEKINLVIPTSDEEALALSRNKDYFENLSISVTLDSHEDGERFNLFATIGPQCDGGILLSGHSDVVPANGPGWTRDPFKLHKENGRLYGRGAVDMKGFLAMAMAVAPSFKGAEDDLQMPLHYAFTFDEEVGSVGAAQMPAFLEKQKIKPSIAIIGEPTGM